MHRELAHAVWDSLSQCAFSFFVNKVQAIKFYAKMEIILQLNVSGTDHGKWRSILSFFLVLTIKMHAGWCQSFKQAPLIILIQKTMKESLHKKAVILPACDYEIFTALLMSYLCLLSCHETFLWKAFSHSVVCACSQLECAPHNVSQWHYRAACDEMTVYMMNQKKTNGFWDKRLQPLQMKVWQCRILL